MILHIVLRWMREHDRRLYIADHGGERAKQRKIVKDLEVIRQALMVGGSEDSRRGLSLFPANIFGFCGSEIRAAAVSIGDIHIMGLIPGLLQQQQRARHIELDIVRMGADGNGYLIHVLPLNVSTCTYWQN